jgi:D-arabinose 1-dehydrogenase-like Zn-dependent alcohol dehydrogenase
MTIRAAVMTMPGKPIEIWELPDPRLEDGSVLLETIGSEVCGTDVHLLHGRLSGVPYPIIPGHVSAGRILRSQGVTHDALGAPISVGDVVTFYDVHGVCNSCWHCLVARQPNRCPSRRVYGITMSANDGALGGWSEQIYLKPGVRILRLPEPLTAADLIGGGCGLFTGYASVERSTLAMGDTVVVQGAGPVGIAAAAFSVLRGAARVIMIGAPAQRLEFAKRMGVDLTLGLDLSREERKEAVMAMTGGRGADVCLEAAGHPSAISEGIDLLRDGGTYVIAGHYSDTGSTELNPHYDINRKHLDIRGQWGTDFHHVTRGMQVLARHVERLPFRDAVSRRYSLDECNEALEDVAALRVIKAAIYPNAG